MFDISLSIVANTQELLLEATMTTRGDVMQTEIRMAISSSLLLPPPSST
jgi:hypothetical protein